MRSFGCRSVFHLVRLEAPKLQHEREDKDIDFAPERVGLRWSAGCQDALRAMAKNAWMDPVDVDTGIVIHDCTHAAPEPALPESGTTGATRPSPRNPGTPAQAKHITNQTIIN